MRNFKRLIFITILIVISTMKGYCKETIQDETKWKEVILAIAFVESKYDSTIVSKSGNHVGYLQISKVMIDDCNEKANYKKYSYKDRFSKTKSIEIFHEVQKRYNPTNNVEKAIRMWNGGQGYTIEKTNSYYKKVMNKLNQIKRENKG